jgi:peptidoglycan L-alanyl-D-glutamate endopeptidase CwlK
VRINELAVLQPIMIPRVNDLLSLLDREGVYGLQAYETARTPWRQAQLWARGRTVAGKKVTKAKAWRSKHQYLLAVDFVFYVDGAWTWDEPEAGMWDLFHNCARRCDLHPLGFEKPHVEVAWNDEALRDGQMPPGFEGSYAHKLLDDWAERWGPVARVESGDTHPGAPPILDIDHRPEPVG